MPDSRILLGVIGRAHGVRGRVRVTSHTADPADLTSYGPLFDEAGRRFLLSWRSEGVAEVAELVGDVRVKVADRTAAEKLTNVRLYVDRAALPAADEDEFYLADLVGAAATGVDGRPVGQVVAVHDYGAGTSIEIERPDASALIVPFTRACVPEIDIAAARIVVVPPLETTAPGDAPREIAAPGADDPGGMNASDGSAQGTGSASSDGVHPVAVGKDQAA